MDEKKGRLGIAEMLKHDLLQTYPVLFEKNGEFVAQIKFVCLITAAQTVRLSPALPLPNTQTENKIQSQELLDLLAQSVVVEKKKREKKAKKPAAAKQ